MNDLTLDTVLDTVEALEASWTDVEDLNEVWLDAEEINEALTA